MNSLPYAGKRLQKRSNAATTWRRVSSKRTAIINDLINERQLISYWRLRTNMRPGLFFTELIALQQTSKLLLLWADHQPLTLTKGT